MQETTALFVGEQNGPNLYKKVGKLMKNSHLDRRSRYSQMVMQEALLNLLQTKELNEITITDVCTLADVNRGTFYKYYSDVPDLLDKTEDAFVKQICTPVFQIAEKYAGRLPDTQDFLTQILQILYDNRDFYCIASKNATYTKRFSEKILVQVEPLMHDVVTENAPNIPEEEIVYLIDFIVGGLSRIFSKWIDDEMKVPIEQLSVHSNAILTHLMKRNQPVIVPPNLSAQREKQTDTTRVKKGEQP